MIEYGAGNFHPRFLCTIRGSVFPFACAVAMPAAILAICLQRYTKELTSPLGFLGLSDKDTVAGQAWSGVTSLLGFVIVFRTSQAYSRFWEGTASMYQMSGEWFDAASSLIAFCKCSNADMRDVAVFQHTLVRLVSMLHAVVLMDLSSASRGSSPDSAEQSARAFELELIDAEGIDRESLVSINEAEEKVELIFHWINQLIVENNSRGTFSVQPPVLTRAFQELAGGMVRYHDAMKIARIPLPFPYIQSLELLLMLHWLATPFLTCMWVRSEVWAGVLTFMQVFFLWSLNCICTELENPFGEDVNDLPAQQMQQEMNKRLLLLIRPSTQRTARLSDIACLEESADDGVSALPTKVGYTKSGVKGMTGAATRLMSRRISLGMLQAAIADEALVEIEEVTNDEETDPEPPDANCTEMKEAAASATTAFRRKGTRQFTIREVKADESHRGLNRVPSFVAHSYGADGMAFLSESGKGETGSRPGSPLAQVTQAAIFADLGQKLVGLSEGLREELRELVAICNELRDRSRSIGTLEVNGFSPMPDGGSLGFSGVPAVPPPKMLPDPSTSPRPLRSRAEPSRAEPRVAKTAPTEMNGCCGSGAGGRGLPPAPKPRTSFAKPGSGDRGGSATYNGSSGHGGYGVYGGYGEP